MQRYGVFSNAPNILQKSCSDREFGENNFLLIDMTYRNKPKGSWDAEDRPLQGTKQPASHIFSDKKMMLQKVNGIKQLMKTENWMVGNRKLNGWKHGVWHAKDFDNHAKYSHSCNQTSDWSQIGEFYISLFFNNLRFIRASVLPQKQCFKTAKACKLRYQSIDFEGQTTSYRMVNCMLLNQNRLPIAQQGAKKHSKRTEFF